MVKRVWKYEIPIADLATIEMPEGSEVLHVAEQHGKPCMWVLVDPTAPKEVRRFRFAGTGHPIENAEAMKHIGSFLMHGGELVFHIFEYAAGALPTDSD